MKIKFLSLIIICDLLLSPVAWALTQADCKDGYQYDSGTNTCKVKNEVAEVQGETEECMKLETPAEQDKCYKDNANKSLQESGIQAPEGMDKVSLLQAITVGISVGIGTLAFVGADTKACQVTSVKLIKAAAIANAVNELGTLVYYLLGLNKTASDFGSVVEAPKTEDESIDDKNKRGVSAQDQAFKHLIEQENSYQTIALLKGTVYAVTAALYAAATVMGIIEQIEITTAQATEKTALTTFNSVSAACAAPPYVQCSAVAPAGAAYTAAVASTKAITQYNTCQSQDSDEVDRLEKEAQKAIDEANTKIAETAQTEAQKAAMTEVEKKAQEEAQAAALKQTQEQLAAKATENAKNLGSNKLMDYKISLMAAVGLPFLLKSMSSSYNPQRLPHHHPLFIFEMMFTQSYNPVNYLINKFLVATGKHYILNSYAAGTADAAVGALGSQIKKLQKMLTKPIPRSIIAGSLALSSGLLSSHAFKERGKSVDREEYLKGIRKDFNKTAAPAIAPCASEDRGNPLKPECYCYNPEGGQNGDRGASNVCQKQWAENPSLNSRGDYDEIAVTENEVPKFCVGPNNGFDFRCKCRDGNGQNTCQFIPPGLNFGGIKSNALTNSINDANALMSGRFKGGELAAQQSNLNALSLLKSADKLAKSKGLDKDMAPLKKQVDNMMNNYSPAVIDAYKNANGIGSNASSNAMASLSPELKKEIESKLDDKFKAVDVEYATGASATATATSSADEFNFNMDEMGTTIEESTAELATADAMNAEYEMNQESDINQGSNTNLFDILSLRYQKSGLRRIFGSKDEQTKIEEAAKTDISQ